LIAGCSIFVEKADAKRCLVSHRLPSMGTVFEIQYIGSCNQSENSLDHRLTLSIKDMLDTMEAHMSLYQTSSEISLLNRTGRIDNPSQDFKEVVILSLKNSPLTEGYFDISVWPVVKLIKASFKETGKPPTYIELEKLRPFVSYKNIKVTDRSIEFLRPGVMITLDGVAKGYAVDKVADFLETNYVHDYIANFSGNMKVKGKQLDGSNWSIGIFDPVIRETIHIKLKDESIATSGVDYAYYSKDKKWHHLINPKTLRPANSLISATIVGPSATLCDVLSKSFVMGIKNAVAIIKKNYPEYRYRLVNKNEVVTNISSFN
jgi:thiamine biosynthesis lipoprotein